MTISATTRRWSYTGNAVTLAFAYTNLIRASTDLQVYVCGTRQTTGYSVSGVGTAAGGNVTFTTAPASGAQIEIVSEMAAQQAVSFTTHGQIDTTNLELALDNNAILSQQAVEKFNRTLHFDIGNPSAATGATVDCLQAGKIIRVRSNCSGLEMVDIGVLTGSAVNITTPVALVHGGTGTAAGDATAARTGIGAADCVAVQQMQCSTYVLLATDQAINPCARMLAVDCSLQRIDGGAHSNVTLSITKIPQWSVFRHGQASLGGQTIATGTLTKVQLDGEDCDTHNAWDCATNYRFTVPNGEGGNYFISWAITLQSITDAKELEAHVMKNGSAATNCQYFTRATGSSTDQITTAGSGLLPNLVAGDYLELWVRHDQGSNQTVLGRDPSTHGRPTFFSGFKVAGA